MKQIRILAIVFTVLMLASLLIGLRIENGISFRRRDISEYNDLIYRMYEDYRAGKPTEDWNKNITAILSCPRIL